MKLDSNEDLRRLKATPSVHVENMHFKIEFYSDEFMTDHITL